jgi:hypothetical protein
MSEHGAECWVVEANKVASCVNVSVNVNRDRIGSSHQRTPGPLCGEAQPYIGHSWPPMRKAENWQPSKDHYYQSQVVRCSGEMVNVDSNFLILESVDPNSYLPNFM